MSRTRGHLPVRMCVVCNKRRPKYELIRLALDRDGMIIVDTDYRKPGRGAYVCPECKDSLKWGKRLQRAFRGKAKGLKIAQTL